MSDDESSSVSNSHDPFAFTAHKFRHKKTSDDEDETTEEEEEKEDESQQKCLPVAKKKKSLTDISIDDDDDEEVENAVKLKSHQNFLPAEVVCLLDDDDDDDDLPKQQTAVTRPPMDAPWNSTIRNYNNLPVMPSVSVPQPPITAEILATMQRARHARDVLLQAQRNPIIFDHQLQFSAAAAAAATTVQGRAMNEHAMMLLRDQQLRMHQQNNYSFNDSLKQQPIHVGMPTTQKGNLITLYLRSSSSSNNNNNNNNVAVKAYTLEPLQTPLIDNYWQNHYQGSISEVSFKFDGETLKLTRTPQSYDMEDGDLIDVVRFFPEARDKNYIPAQAAASKVVPAANYATCNINTFPSRNATVGAVYDPTSSLNIILRTRIVHFKKNNTTTAPIIRQWQLRRTDCLDKLIQAYRKERSISSSVVINLLMDNRNIDSVGMTPLVLGLNDYYLLDMHVYDGEGSGDDDVVVRHLQQPQQTNANMIRLILRINGNDATKEEYSIHKRDKFEQLHEAFCHRMQQKNKMFNSVKLTLDGAVLSLNDTCHDEDLEGGEIIDIICQ
jgi:hypothetical protein